MAARALWTVIICAEIAATSLACASTCPTDPADPTGRKQWCSCPTSSTAVGAATVVNMSSRASDDFLRAAKEKGITTIFRYYDWPHKPDESVKLERQERWRLISSTCQADETCDKVVTREEIDLIHSYGLRVAIVFQHFSYDWDTWLDKERPAYDASQAIQLAKQLGQPAGSTIFFGVDGADENFIEHGDASAGMSHIKNYFSVVTDLVTRAGYVVGVYGSGFACDELVVQGEKSPRLCWLSMSTGHPHSQAREASGKWTMKQCAERQNFLGTSTEVDPDVVNTSISNFGQW